MICQIFGKECRVVRGHSNRETLGIIIGVINVLKKIQNNAARTTNHQKHHAPDAAHHHSELTMKGTIKYLLLSLLLAACSPGETEIMKDFSNIFSENMPACFHPENVVVTTGEGDSDNVYKHIKFDAVCNQDAEINNGWLSGRIVKKDQVLSGGELVILYQKDDGQWKPARHELVHDLN